jgi:glycosyltransferase involved in cell wall biosynthesis
MRLLFTIPDFWPGVRRGSERLVHDLAQALAGRGHEVTVATRRSGASPGVTAMDGFRVRRLRGDGWVRGIGWQPLEGFALTAARAALTTPADIRHAFYMTDAYGLARARRLRRGALVVSLHGVPGRAWWDRTSPRTSRWFARAVRAADAVSVMTEQLRAPFREQYGVDPVVLVPGIFVEDYARERRAAARTIVCAASLDDPRKRVDLLVEAFGLLAADDREVDLLLVGPGERGPARAAVSRLPAGVRERVRFENTSDLPSIYTRCAVGALVSTAEAFGLAAVEYLAAGMPAVVGDDGGAASIITEETGVSFAGADAAACAEALGRALRMSVEDGAEARCRARARDFDWSVRLPAYEELYRRLM